MKRSQYAYAVLGFTMFAACVGLIVLAFVQERENMRVLRELVAEVSERGTAVEIPEWMMDRWAPTRPAPARRK